MTAWFDSHTEKKIAEFDERVCPIWSRADLVKRFFDAEREKKIIAFFYTARAKDGTFVYIFDDSEGNALAYRHSEAIQFLKELGV